MITVREWIHQNNIQPNKIIIDDKYNIFVPDTYKYNNTILINKYTNNQGLNCFYGNYCRCVYGDNNMDYHFVINIENGNYFIVVAKDFLYFDCFNKGFTKSELENILKILKQNHEDVNLLEWIFDYINMI